MEHQLLPEQSHHRKLPVTMHTKPRGCKVRATHVHKKDPVGRRGA